MRILGLDIDRSFAEVVALEDGVLSRLGRVDIGRRHLESFAGRLQRDEVVLEATGNALAVAEVLRPLVGRVVIANSRRSPPKLEARDNDPTASETK